MTDGIRPFSHQQPLPPVDERWALRRQISDTIKALTENLTTHDASSAELQKALALLTEAKASLGQGDQVQGKLAWHARPHSDGEPQGNGNYHQVSRELAPIGGVSNPLAPEYHMWVDFENREAHGWAKFGWAFEGPPTFVHGGWVAAVFDEFMGCAQVFCDNPGVTGTLSIRYKQPTPINTRIELHARLKEVNGRKIVIEGKMIANGVVTATCEALFVSIDGGVKNIVTHGKAEQ